MRSSSRAFPCVRLGASYNGPIRASERASTYSLSGDGHEARGAHINIRRGNREGREGSSARARGWTGQQG